MVDLPSTALLQPCMALEAGDGEGESQGTGKENLRGLYAILGSGSGRREP
jgi:hypothetical protein